MGDVLAKLRQNFTLSGDLAVDAAAFLRHHDCPKTAIHCGDVAAESRRIALLAGESPEQAEIAGWMHDISTVIPNDERIAAAEEFGVEVLPEEASFPMIIHQKLSVVLAREIFGVQDSGILSAIGCHTTLKRDATPLDTVVFVADKTAWDMPGTPPYQTEILAALDISVDHAALVYLIYLWDMRDKLRVAHPWFIDAYKQLSVRLNGDV